MPTRKQKTWIILVATAIIIKIFSLFPPLVERYYSEGIYPFISTVQRILFGWLPISIGDIFYGAVVMWLIISVVRLVRSIIKKQFTRSLLLRMGIRIVRVCLWVYIIFNILWGLNYNRLGIGGQLQLKPSAYSVMELQAVLNLAIDKLNVTADSALHERPLLKSKQYVFKEGNAAYRGLYNSVPFLEY